MRQPPLRPGRRLHHPWLKGWNERCNAGVCGGGLGRGEEPSVQAMEERRLRSRAFSCDFIS
jgi:hypothetical protein